MSSHTPAAASAGYQRGWRKYVFRSLAVMLSLTVAGGIAELSLRTIGYNRSYVSPFSSFHQPDPVLGWRGKPNFSGHWRQGDFDVFIAQTENGFRRLDHGKDPEDVQNTVYVLGDSFVWGYGTSQGENVADQLNFLLPTQQVENFGLAGAGTVQEHAVFEQHVRPSLRRGDTVLVFFYGNDFGDNMGRILEGSLHAEVRDGRVRPVPPDPSRAPSELMSKLKDWSYLFNLLASPAVISDASPEVQVTHCYLEKFKKACDEKHAQLLVAYIPGQAELEEDDCSFTEDLSPAQQIGYRKAFFRCVDQLGIETIDLLPRMLAAKKAHRFDRLTFQHDFHWNKNAHLLAAETVSSVLADKAENVARKATGTLRH
jgi:lysophospholipase L1-like esterase